MKINEANINHPMNNCRYSLIQIEDVSIIQAKSRRYGVKFILSSRDRDDRQNNRIYFPYFIWLGTFKDFTDSERRRDETLWEFFDQDIESMGICTDWLADITLKKNVIGSEFPAYLNLTQVSDEFHHEKVNSPEDKAKKHLILSITFK